MRRATLKRPPANVQFKEQPKKYDEEKENLDQLTASGSHSTSDMSCLHTSTRTGRDQLPSPSGRGPPFSRHVHVYGTGAAIMPVATLGGPEVDIFIVLPRHASLSEHVRHAGDFFFVFQGCK